MREDPLKADESSQKTNPTKHESEAEQESAWGTIDPLVGGYPDVFSGPEINLKKKKKGISIISRNKMITTGRQSSSTQKTDVGKAV